MAKHLQRWSPDTCGCVFIQSFDDELLIDKVEIFHESTEVICDDHKGLEKNEHYDIVLNKENRVKNGHIKHIESFVNLTIQNENDNGEISNQMHPKLVHLWRFTGKGKNRTLEVQFGKKIITDEHKKKLQNMADKEFGIGKVIIK